MKTFNKRNLLLTVASLVLSLNVAFAQAPAIEWQKAFGGSGYDLAYCIIQTNDGGYIVAGESDSPDGDITGNHGKQDYWIVKLDTARNIQWQKSLGGSEGDYPSCIKQSSDGGYIVVGTSASVDGDITGHHGGIENSDIWIVKLDASGNIQWKKSLGGSKSETAYSIEQTPDGGFILAGFSSSIDGDLSGNNGISGSWIVKLSALGNIQWQILLPGGAGKIKQTAEGGYIVAGDTLVRAFDNVDYWIVKLDNNGIVQWQKTFGGSDRDVLNSFTQTLDGGYILAGYTWSNDGDVTFNHGSDDCWIVKLAGNGNIQWQKSYGGTNYDEANSVLQTADGGYFVSGITGSNDGDVTGNHGTNDFWVLKLDSLGNLIWQKSLGGSNSDIAYSSIITSDGGYLIAGFTYSNNGEVTGNHGYQDYWIVKLGGNCTVPTMPSSITTQGGIPKVCPGDTRTYTTAQATGVTYNWTVPTGAVINSGQGTRSINVTYNNNFTASGVISVVKVNSCGSSAPRNLIVNKNIPATPSNITGPNFGLCGGHNIVYSVQQVQGMTYNWTVPGLAHIVSGQGTNIITVNFQTVNFAKTISVTANNYCGTSATRSLIIRSAPQKPGAISGNANVCSNSTGNAYSIAPVASATYYIWTGPTGSHLTANGITSVNNVLNTPSNTVTIDFGAITSTSRISVKAGNTCGSSTYNYLYLTNCVGIFNCTINKVDNTVCNPNCNGTTTVIPANGTAPYTYEWSNSDGVMSQTTQTLTGLCGDNYTVIVTDNNGNTSSCNTALGGGTAFTLPTLQGVDIMFSGYCSPYCNGYINMIPSLGSPQDYTYLWSNGATTSMISGLCGYYAGDPAGDYSVTVWDAAGCSQSAYYFMENHISFLAAWIQILSNESAPGASDGECEVNISHGWGPFTYQWSNGQSGSTASGLTAGTYTVTITDVSHCSITKGVIIITLPPRLADATSPGKQISARPNPFTDVLNIDVTTDEDLIITINDVTGREIAVYPNINSSFIISEKLKAGMYYIVTENKSGTYRNVLKVVRSN